MLRRSSPRFGLLACLVLGACTPGDPSASQPADDQAKQPEAKESDEPTEAKTSGKCEPLAREGMVNLRMLSQGSVPATRTDLAVDLETGRVRGTRAGGEEAVEGELQGEGLANLNEAVRATCVTKTTAGVDDSGGGFTMFQMFGDAGATEMVAPSMAGMGENEDYLQIERADWEQLIALFPKDAAAKVECTEFMGSLELCVEASSVPGKTDICLNLMSGLVSGTTPSSADAGAKPRKIDAMLEEDKLAPLVDWLDELCLPPKTTNEPMYQAPGGYSLFRVSNSKREEVYLLHQNTANEVPAGATYYELDDGQWDALHEHWPEF